jgi:hypothetical protein
LSFDLLEAGLPFGDARNDGVWLFVREGQGVDESLDLPTEPETLAEMNDRTRSMDDEMATIEQVVGALMPSAKGRSATEVVAGMNKFASSLGTTMPSWLTERFVLTVQERMRQLVGRWKATPRGSVLDLTWPEARFPYFLGSVRSGDRGTG